MEVKPDYRKTAIGVIPKDWEICRLSDLIDNSRHIRYGIVQPDKFTPDGCFMLRSQDYSKGWAGPDNMHKINRDLENQYRNARIQCGDLVITVVGAGIGQVVTVPSWLDGAILSRSTARIAVDTNKAARGFVKAILESPVGQRQILDCQKVGAQPVVSCLDLANFFIPVPPLSEQSAIAATISDIDALLDAIERLIAKKRDLKQATMQQLLTGKTRLPNFGGEWKNKRLGDVLTICHGKSQRDVETVDGPYPILATGGQIGTATRALYDKPSVLIGRKGTINQPQYKDTPFWTVDTLFYSAIKEANSAKFLYYRFMLIDWMQFNEASGVPSLNARTIEGIEVKIPSPAEQDAIAAILSDMDAEITALENRLAKTRLLKQGMMQQLLTGQIRLKQEEPFHARAA